MAATVTPELIQANRTILDNKLRDYPATRFRDVGAYRASGGSIVFCGRMNTTNGFGAPTGWKMFTTGVAMPPSFQLIVRDGECPYTTRVDEVDYSAALAPG